MTVSARSLRSHLLIGASLATLSVAGTAHAQNLGAGRMANPAVAAAQASQNAATRNAAAQAAAARTRAAFDQASRVRQQMDAAQAAAREAARAAQSNIPNGLGAGGLQVANGVEVDPSLWVGANGPTQSEGANGRTNVTVEQTQEKAILTWDSFNVGRETDLAFDQQGNANWIALNRVTSASADPTQILGSIKADGSVYIINPNGVIFGGASQVNVRSIIASSLDIHGGAVEYTRPSGVSDEEWDKLKVTARNDRFNAGILAANTGGNQFAPLTFSDGMNVASSTSQPEETFDPSDGVTVEAGAQISVRDGQQAVLLGHNVTNRGTITADDGQVLLVAGRSVLMLDGNLREPRQLPQGEKIDGPAIRGFIAGVDRGGLVQNDGLVDVGTGNVTMLGKNVTQAGTLFATTSGEIAGSILLQAQDGMARHNTDHTRRLSGFNQGGTTPRMSNGRGLVLLSGDSYAAILPDTEALAVVGNPYTPSWMQVEAGQIRMMDNAALYLPSGSIELRASPSSSGADTSRIYIDRGASIDVSGLGGVEVDIEQNSIRAEVRANELADNPVMRDSALRGETVHFDGRLGEKLTDGSGVADLSGWYDLVERDVTQFMTTGGSVSLSGNEVITREGSVIDLSGGSVQYSDGVVRRTKLIDEFGRLVSIEEAIAGVKYVGVEGDFVVNHARWGVTERFENPFARTSGGGWQKGYVEGRSAGSLLLNDVRQINDVSNDAFRIFDGQVRADIVVGEYQTGAPAGADVTDMTQAWRERPSLATLSMGRLELINNGYRPLGGNVTIAERDTVLGEDFTAETELVNYGTDSDPSAINPDIQPYQHILDADWFNGSLFGNVDITGGYIDGGATAAVPTPPFGHGGTLTIGEGVTVNLGDYGSLVFTGHQANIDGRIIAPGGAVDLVGVYAPNVDSLNPWESLTSAERPGIHLGSTGVIDVAGRWINQFANPDTFGPIDGGSVSLTGFNVHLEEGSLVDVSGGAMMRTDGSLILGDGGAILIDGSVPYLSGTGTSVGSSIEGEKQFVLDGALVGYAPGRGGSLTIDAPLGVVIADEFGELASVGDGVLEAGTAAPRDLALAEPVTIPAGTVLDFEGNRTVSGVLTGGETLVAPAMVTANGTNDSITVLVDWVVPEGVTVRLAPTNPIVRYTEGQTVPAGTRLASFGTAASNGTLPAGFTVPAGVFRYADGTEGLKLSATGAQVLVPAGVPLAQPIVLGTGFVIPEGAVLAQSVNVSAPLLVTPEHFTQGGFADFAVSGALGLTVKADTKIAPTVDIMRLDASALRTTASGARLLDMLGAGGAGVTLQNSSDLPEALRPAISLTLGTTPIDPVEGTRPNRIRAGLIGFTPAAAALINATRHPGTVQLETGSTINMYAGSNVTIDALTGIYIDGTISTPGGRISIAEPAAQQNQQAAQVRLGANARLLAQGYQRTSFVDGFEVRSVETGGVISIGGGAEFGASASSPSALVMIDQGAVLDVSGIAGVADLLPGGGRGTDARVISPHVPVAVDGAGGAIEIAAASGVLAGDWRAGAGGSTGYGGSITIYSGSNTSNGIEVRQNADISADPVTELTPAPGPILTMIADTINGSNADHLLMGTNNLTQQVQNYRGIVFDGPVSLATRRSITINSSRISRTAGEDAVDGDVDIRSGHVWLRGGEVTRNETLNVSAPTFAPDTGGTLSIHADVIDVSGIVKIGLAAAEVNNANRTYGRGFETTELIATGDIRLQSYQTGLSPSNVNLAATGLRAGENLVFDAAQVIAAPFGNTITDRATNLEVIEPPENVPGFLVQAGDSITIRSNGNAAPVPYSFAQRLTFAAPVIEQGGVVRAPYGQIRFNADERLTLLPGSLTSVSLEGLTVPFGYLGADGLFGGMNRAGATVRRSIRLEGPEVEARDGAVVDVSGGGDLLGWTFLGGNEGGTNLLADRSVERFAILPDLRDGVAPWHTNAKVGSSGVSDSLSDSRLQVGDSVWLADVPGLAPGYYTLLPAHYAQLEGAYLVDRLEGVTAAPVANQRRPDGSFVTSGRLGVAGTDIRQAGYSSFLVRDADAWRPYASFLTLSFNKSARDLAEAAGVPTVRTANDAGSVVFAARDSLLLAATGRFGGGEGGLSGNLDVAASAIAITDANGRAPDGYLRLEADQLTSFGAASLLLGGTRVSGEAGTTIDTIATDVLVGDGVSLTGQELILASLDTLTIGDGVSLIATGPESQDRNSLLLAGDGALLRLSTGDRVGIARTGGVGSAGTLTIGSGASLTSEGALSLDSSRAIELATDAVLDTAQLDLASVRVNLGEVPEGEPGTTLGLGTVARLASATDLLIRGHESINLYDGFALGARGANGEATLRSLTFDTASLVGRGADVSVAAETLTLQNSGAAAAEGLAGTGDLAIDVDRLVLAAGSTQITGFAAMTGAAREIAVTGRGGLDIDGGLSLETGRIVAASGSDYELAASGAVAFTSGTALAGTQPSGLGGRLAISGGSVHFDTNAELAGGVAEIRAEGGNLTIGGNARIDVSGRAVDFVDVAKFAPGGTIRLAASGDVATAQGAVLDVSGNVRGGAAGAISVTAGGRADLQGEMLASGHEAAAGGSFDLDAGAADFGALNTLLNAGRFNASRDIRLRDESILLTAGERIEAHRVVLQSDAGDVRIAGTIAAGGNAINADGGMVRLAGRNVVLDATARIEADAAAAGADDYQPASGNVELVADSGWVRLASGAAIDLSGGRQGGGRITVRGARNTTGVNAELGATITGARERLLVGSAVYDADAVDAPMVVALLDTANAWHANVNAPAGWTSGAGIILRSAGDLTVDSTIDLAALGGAGYLGLEASDDLLINASISDGFGSAATSAALRNDASASYGFEAGGDVVIGAGQLVRTGTGDIRIVAGGDIRLAGADSVIYTAGRATDTRAGFTRTQVHGDYPTQGGSIALIAGRDIVSPVVNQSAAAWLFRSGTTNFTRDRQTSTVASQTSWSIKFSNFQSGVGALGGGDITVNAGRDIQDLSLAIATTGHLATPVGQRANEAGLEVRGGGNLALSTGRDLLGGVLLLGQGVGDLRIGRDVTGGAPAAMRNNTNDNSPTFAMRPVALLAGLMDAQLKVTALGDAEIEAAYDPMLLPQIAQNLSGGVGSAWESYSVRAALSVDSIGGDVLYRNSPLSASDLSRGGAFEAVARGQSGNSNLLILRARIAPPTLRLASFEGDVALRNYLGTSVLAANLVQAAAPTGTLEALAGGNLDIWDAIRIQDVGLDYRRDALAPMRTDSNNAFLTTTVGNAAIGTATNFDRGFTPLHLGDPEPVRLVALNGDIGTTRVPESSVSSWGVIAPKPIFVFAGGDINRGSIDAQHNDPQSISRVIAGGDILGNSASFSGQGLLAIQAGGSIVLREGLQGSQVLSRGNMMSARESNRSDPNLALPDIGGDIVMIAGTANGVNAGAFADLYLNPENQADSEFPLSHPNNAGKVVHTYEEELDAFLAGFGLDDLAPEDRLAAFRTLSEAAQQSFLWSVLFTELRETGIDYNEVGGPRFQQNARGYNAIELLFPGSTDENSTLGGDIDLRGGPVQTQSGGNISVLAPYGAVSVGLATAPANQTGTGGIVTRRGGDVRVLSNNNIDLHISRLFTLQGGDVTLWTSNGDITAGAGAKTTVFNVPLTYRTSNSGDVAVDVFGLATGAGIGVLDALQGEDKERERSRLDLLAFRGEVNAGDAGIRVVGDINIAALRVVNAANIEVSGEAVGIPEVPPVNMGALTAASAATSAVINEAAQLAERSRPQVRTEMPTILNVRFLGFGE